MEPWRAPVVRLGGGQVVVRGSALVEVLRALDTATRVARGHGIAPPPTWMHLRAELAAEAECIRAGRTAASGSDPAAGSAAGASVAIVQHVELVTTAEAAAMLSCQVRNVRDLHTRGVLDSGRKVGGRLMFDRLEIEAEAHRRAEAARDVKESA
jgi:hypothetical protein